MPNPSFVAVYSGHSLYGTDHPCMRNALVNEMVFYTYVDLECIASSPANLCNSDSAVLCVSRRRRTCAPFDSFREEDPAEVIFLPAGPVFGIISNFGAFNGSDRAKLDLAHRVPLGLGRTPPLTTLCRT
ncbi:hypothetical protein HPB50_027068 [Hyalomma asiaticum]|uniref:Uncharacterized protein n=1 Tax=Hyalomma asiaticum TaxID=266040 RepID=A0ACB7RVU0_HYAAI|nr:hypothetical protein HPB50_027068 [Hyalomma asiaticum]